MKREASLMWTTVPFDSRTLPSHFKAACFRGGLAEGPLGLQKPATHFRLHVLLVTSTCGDEMIHVNAGETQ